VKQPRTRQDVLDEINRTMRFYGLPEWQHVRRLGSRRKKDLEVVGISCVTHYIEKYLVVIVFNVVEPGKNEPFGYAVRFNTRPTLAAIVRVNGYYLFVEQSRFAIGQRVTEVLRGWVEPGLINAEPSEQVLGLIARKCSPAYANSLQRLQLNDLGYLYDDTSTRGDKIQLYAVDAVSTVEPPNRCHIWKPKLFTWPELLEAEAANKLAIDLHSSAVLRRYSTSSTFRVLESAPQ